MKLWVDYSTTQETLLLNSFVLHRLSRSVFPESMQEDNFKPSFKFRHRLSLYIHFLRLSHRTITALKFVFTFFFFNLLQV